jgi:hypothetical protein
MNKRILAQNELSKSATYIARCILPSEKHLRAYITP